MKGEGGNRTEDTQGNEDQAMNDPKNLSDDPRLTAYALGELAGEEHAQVAAAVAADPALQAAVEEIRATAGRLTAALAADPLPEIAPAPIESYHTVRSARIFRFPYWTVAALAAAACFAVIIALRELPLAEKDAKQRLYSFIRKSKNN